MILFSVPLLLLKSAPIYHFGLGKLGRSRMDYVVEAKKFVERAHQESHPEVVKEHLKMAEWCLKQALEERGDNPDHVPRKAN